MMKTIQNCQFTAHSRNGLPQEVPVTVPAQSRHYSTYFTSEADERSGGWIFTVTLTYIATVDSYLTERPVRSRIRRIRRARRFRDDDDRGLSIDGSGRRCLSATLCGAEGRTVVRQRCVLV